MMILRALLYFFGDIVAFEAAGTDLQRQGSSLDFGLNLHQIGFPNPAGTVFGVAYSVAGYRMLSANIASP
jgi:hypothetical protein